MEMAEANACTSWTRVDGPLGPIEVGCAEPADHAGEHRGFTRDNAVVRWTDDASMHEGTSE